MADWKKLWLITYEARDQYDPEVSHQHMVVTRFHPLRFHRALSERPGSLIHIVIVFALEFDATEVPESIWGPMLLVDENLGGRKT